MSDPEFRELYDKLQNNAFSGHAKQLGLLCIFWSHLETSIDMLLVTLLHCEERSFGGVIANIMSLRDKIAAIRACGFKSAPSKDWYDELEKSLILIDQDLRLQRNRMVHDVYWPLEEGMIRHQRMAKVVKEQSRTKVLKMFHHEPIKESDLVVLTIRILTETQRLSDLRAELSPSNEIFG